MRALSPTAAFQNSVSLFRRRPWATLGLGVALLTSLAAVCCGLGIFAAPWFLCELFALQIALGTENDGPPPPRTSAWFAAAGVQMVAVTVLFAIASLSLLALGPDVVLGGIALRAPSSAELLVRVFGVLILASALVLAVSVHFEHTPAILIDRGGGLHAAMLESARLVSETGALRTWLTSVVAHALQMAPGLLAVAFAASSATLGGTLRWGSALLPVVALCLALGQGMVVSSYLNLRDSVTDPHAVPVEAAPSKSGAFVWSLLLMCVLSGPLLVMAALAKPAPAAQQALPADARVVLSLNLARSQTGAPEPPRQLYLPGSALRLTIHPEAVAVTASDGGGVGDLPLPRVAVAGVRAAKPARLPLEMRS
jgi:hypothetical protein